MSQTRNRRAGVEDRWSKTVRLPVGTAETVHSASHAKGLRWRARYVDENGKEHARGFGRKRDAQAWLNKQLSDQVTGTWTDPVLSGVTFGVMAERWLSTKANRSAKTVAGYRSLMDAAVLPDGRTWRCGRRPACAWCQRLEKASDQWWQVLDSNQCRHTPTDLQSAPIGRSGNLPPSNVQRAGRQITTAITK